MAEALLPWEPEPQNSNERKIGSGTQGKALWVKTTRYADGGKGYFVKCDLQI